MTDGDSQPFWAMIKAALLPILAAGAALWAALNAHRAPDVVSAEDRELARENGRLRREIRMFTEERDILKSHPVLRDPWRA